MAYQTGTISSAADLKALLLNFAQSNGWTLSGDVVSKGDSHVRVSNPSTSLISITAARNGNFVAPDICPRETYIRLTSWPALATYHIAAFSSPDTIWCTINFDTTDYMHIGFGYMEKYSNWVGGTWFHAQHPGITEDDMCYGWIGGGDQKYYGDKNYPRAGNCIPFWEAEDGADWNYNWVGENKPALFHCEERGYVWEATFRRDGQDKDLNSIKGLPTHSSPAYKNQPNNFNGQTVLWPFTVGLLNTDGHHMMLGSPGHIRLVRLFNYNPGDVIQIGTDRWKVYPFHRKDTARPDGAVPSYGSGTYSTGVQGVAVRYDGP